MNTQEWEDIQRRTTCIVQGWDMVDNSDDREGAEGGRKHRNLTE